MNKDFRVSVTLPTHPKTLKLMRKLGDRAFYNLIRLWAFVSTNKPDGNLSGYDEDDIEIAADWTGTPGEFVATLLDPKIRFLDEVEGGFMVHDWQDHNEYACHAEARSKKAKKAAAARWGNRPDESGNENSDAKKCSGHAPSNAGSNGKQCPSPNPSPSPSPTPVPSPDKSNLTNVSGDPLPDPQSESRHFRQKTGEYFEQIKVACAKVDQMRLDGFNPYKFVQQWINNRGHPGAILHTLNQISKSRFEIPKPWGFANKIMKTENGNYNEADAIHVHNQFKAMDSGQLSALTHGLIRRIA